MSKYVPDSSTRRWVILSDNRTKRGNNIVHHKSHACIFCEGHENLTPDEVYRLGAGHPNTPNWKVRVIKNKYPITDIHEVVIHSPNHDHDFEQFHHTQSENVFDVYRARFNEHSHHGQVMIFNNHGEHAGASQAHPHSQIVVIPHQINLDTLKREPVENLVVDTANFCVYCPDFSQWPYETWIAPKKETTLFGDITDDEISDISLLMKRVTKALNRIYVSVDIFAKIDRKTHPFGYNFYIYPKKNWYLRIIPRFIHKAGFEFGTGLSVNMVDPADVASDLGEFML